MKEWFANGQQKNTKKVILQKGLTVGISTEYLLMQFKEFKWCIFVLPTFEKSHKAEGSRELAITPCVTTLNKLLILLQVFLRLMLCYMYNLSCLRPTSVPWKGVTSDPVAIKIFLVCITSELPSSLCTVTLTTKPSKRQLNFKLLIRTS